MKIYKRFKLNTTVQGLLPDFGVTLKNRKKSNFDRNQLKLSMQHKRNYKNGKFSPSHFWRNLAKHTVL